MISVLFSRIFYNECIRNQSNKIIHCQKNLSCLEHIKIMGQDESVHKQVSLENIRAECALSTSAKSPCITTPSRKNNFFEKHKSSTYLAEDGPRRADAQRKSSKSHSLRLKYFKPNMNSGNISNSNDVELIVRKKLITTTTTTTLNPLELNNNSDLPEGQDRKLEDENENFLTESDRENRVVMQRVVNMKRSFEVCFFFRNS